MRALVHAEVSAPSACPECVPIVRAPSVCQFRPPPVLTLRPHTNYGAVPVVGQGFACIPTYALIAPPHHVLKTYAWMFGHVRTCSVYIRRVEISRDLDLIFATVVVSLFFQRVLGAIKLYLDVRDFRVS